jgi:16S rRNA (guanine966-N2)-methyltransferase
MRVVAGSLRGRRIEAPEGDTTRPTTDMAREAIFNSLGSHYDLSGARIVDCFAGTGALGMEALSRGAGHVTFIERDKRALDILKLNLDTLGLVDSSTVVRGDALAQVAQCKDATLVLADPPYDFAKWPEFLAAVPCNLVVAEAGDPIAAPPGWEVLRERRYGRTHVTFLRRVP